MSLLPRDIKEFLAPFKLMVNRHALSATYKTLELGPDRVKGCSSYGVLEVFCQLGIDELMYVDATAFLALVDSLPADEALDIVNLDGVMAWGCGSAKGKLALATIDNMPAIDRKPNGGWTPDPMFGPALNMGAISCDSNTLASVGVYGVVIDNRDDMSILTSDNITVSAAVIAGTKVKNVPGITTLAPEAAAVLAEVVTDKGRLEIDATSVYYHDEFTRLLLKLVTPLKHDLVAVLNNFSQRDLVAPIPRDRIAAFIKRTAAISETRKHSYVTLHAQEGQLAISFEEATAGSDEFYLVDGLQLPDSLEIKLDAAKLSRALAHVDSVVLDHVDRGAVLFTGSKPDFTYMVAGRA